MTTSQKQFVDFARLRETISLRDVLDHYGVTQTLKGKGQQRRGPDPFTDSDPKKTPFSVNFDKNAWRLFGADEKAGGIIDFVAEIEDCSIREAGLRLAEEFGIDDEPSSRRRKKQERRANGTDKTDSDADEDYGEGETVAQACVPLTEPADTTTRNPPLSFSLQNLDPEAEELAPWCERHKVLPDTLTQFEAGFYTGDGKTMRGRLAVPIHSPDGTLVGYCGLAVRDGQKPSAKFPRDWMAGVEIYNLHRAIDALDRIEDDDDELPTFFVVRDIVEVWQLYERGIETAVALMVPELTPVQLQRLQADGLFQRTSVVIQLAV